MKPAGLVFGTVACSTTLIQGVAGIDVKDRAAALMSSSVIERAKPAMSAVLPFPGSEVLGARLRKPCRCCTKYSYDRPVILACSGRPLPFGMWHSPQAKICGCADSL